MKFLRANYNSNFMKGIFWIGILSSLIQSLYAFDCSSTDDTITCEQLRGCFWIDGTGCSGTFTSTCNPPACHFVDPSHGNDSQEGSSLAPFQTLSTAFQKLQGQNGDIIIINDKPNPKVDLLDYVAISSAITVRFVNLEALY